MSEWRQTKIRDIVRFHRGITWSADQETQEPRANDVPVLRIPNVKSYLDLRDILFLRGISESAKNKFAARRNWILLVGSNGNPDRVGNCVIIDHDSEYLFASFLVGAEVRDESDYDPYFVYYFINSPKLQKAITDSVQGSTGLRNINLSRLGQKEVQIPPKCEQRRIAEILTTVDRRIEKTEALIAKHQAIKQGMMADLLTRGIDETGSLRRSSSTPFWKSWGMSRCRLQELAAIRYGESPSAVYTDESSIPVYGSSGRVGWSKKALYNEPLVVVARKGTLTTPSFSVGPCWVSDTAFAVVPYNNVDPSWLYYSLANCDLEALNEATGVPSISHGYLSRLSLYTPPYQEQRRIAEILTTVDRQIEAEQHHRDKLTAIKCGLVQDLLTGKVQVHASEAEEAQANA